MFAWALYILTIIEIVAMLAAPLVTLRTTARKPWLRARVTWWWLSSLAGYCLVNHLRKSDLGSGLVLDVTTSTILAVASWVTFVGGFVVVIVAFVKSSRMRKQQLG